MVIKKKSYLMFLPLYLWVLGGLADSAFGQAEVMAWGNLTGIRIDGQLMEFGTSLCVVQPAWSGITRTAKERQTTSYSRSGNTAIVKLQMAPQREIRLREGADWAFSATETVETTGPGTARIDVEFVSAKVAEIAGAFLCLELPASYYSSGRVQLIEPASSAVSEISLIPGVAEQNEYLRTTAKGITIIAPLRRIEVTFGELTEVMIRDDRRQGSYDIQVYLGVLSGRAAEGRTEKRSFNLKADGEIDRKAVAISIEAARPGQAFDGLGGNFRLQNPRTDPPVIQYNLDNLRVAWARVEMPWRFWQPTEDVDPLADAREGKIDPRVHQAMDMARRLAQRRMPVIVSAWNAPNWAVLGAQPGAAPQPGAPRGTPLNPEKMTRILAISQPKSILQWQLTADYSLLAGGGIFGDNGPLRPTQRFWNLKQLASTPPGVFALPVICNQPGISCAAFGDIANSIYVLHVVNNGAARPATLTGLPADLKQFRIWVTDSGRGMQEGSRTPVSGGKAEITLDATSFTTLISVP